LHYSLTSNYNTKASDYINLQSQSKQQKGALNALQIVTKSNPEQKTKHSSWNNMVGGIHEQRMAPSSDIYDLIESTNINKSSLTLTLSP